MLRWWIARLRQDVRGFTLLELAIVVVVISLIAAIAVPVFLSQRGKAQDSATVQEVSQIVGVINAGVAGNWLAGVDPDEGVGEYTQGDVPADATTGFATAADFQADVPEGKVRIASAGGVMVIDADTRIFANVEDAYFCVSKESPTGKIYGATSNQGQTGVQQVVGVKLVGNEVVETVFEAVGEDPLYGAAVIMDRDDPVHARHAQQLGVELPRKGLAIEFFEIVDVTIEVRFPQGRVGAPVLGAVEQVGLHEDHFAGAVFLGGPGHDEGAHGQVLPAHHSGGGGDDHHRFPRELATDAGQITFVGDEAGAELAVGEGLHADEVSDIRALPDGVGQVDSEGIVGGVPDDDQLIGQRFVHGPGSLGAGEPAAA